MINIDKPIKIKSGDVRKLLQMDSLILNPFKYRDIETYKLIFAAIVCLIICIFSSVKVNIHDEGFQCITILAAVIYGLSHTINGIVAIVNSTRFKDFQHAIVHIVGLIGCGLLIHGCMNMPIQTKGDDMNLILSLLSVVTACLLCVIRHFLYQHANNLRTSSIEHKEIEIHRSYSSRREFTDLTPDDLQVHKSFITPRHVVDALNNFIKKKIMDNDLSYCELRRSKISVWFTKYDTDVVYTIDMSDDCMYLIAITTKTPVKPKEPTANDELSQHELQIIASIMRKQSINASRD